METAEALMGMLFNAALVIMIVATMFSAGLSTTLSALGGVFKKRLAGRTGVDSSFSHPTPGRLGHGRFTGISDAGLYRHASAGCLSRRAVWRQAGHDRPR